MLEWCQALTVWECVALVGVLVVLVLMLVYYLLLAVAFLSKRRVHRRPEEASKVSVVLRSGFDLEQLKANLPIFLTQSYAPYELIVVDESGDSEINTYLSLQAQEHAQMQVRTMQPDALFTCHSKLAITVGTQASTGEWIVLAEAGNPPASREWLRTLAENFSPSCHVVIGYARYPQGRRHDMWIWTAKSNWQQLLSIAFARNHWGYFAPASNLAFRRSRYVAVRGFAGVAHLQGADTTLLTDRMALGDNAVAECRKASQVKVRPLPNAREAYREALFAHQAWHRLRLSARAATGLNPLLRCLSWVAPLPLLVECEHGVLLYLLVLPAVRWFLLTLVVLLGMRHLQQRWNPLSMVAYDLVAPWIWWRAHRKYMQYRKNAPWR